MTETQHFDPLAEILLESVQLFGAKVHSFHDIHVDFILLVWESWNCWGDRGHYVLLDQRGDAEFEYCYFLFIHQVKLTERGLGLI